VNNFDIHSNPHMKDKQLYLGIEENDENKNDKSKSHRNIVPVTHS
jgi:hypothetical protein